MELSAVATGRRHDPASESVVPNLFGTREVPLPAGLKLSEERGDGTAILVLEGEFDLHTAPDVALALEVILRRAPGRLVVDLARVNFLNSAGLEVLLACHRQAAPATDLRIVATTRATWRPLQLAGLPGTLVIHASRASAVAE
ncbi:STAS domain-containing protein [Amycolatopsis sp. MEPSY49]|uniref:STAS domain-containing protein n=1 Tax=Amycolatopsis sp. MEPSY49 TaxID=3151600 RepID=UPI003EF56C6D